MSRSNKFCQHTNIPANDERFPAIISKVNLRKEKAIRQSACLVFNPITVNNFASLFNCTPVGRASDSMMAPT